MLWSADTLHLGFPQRQRYSQPGAGQGHGDGGQQNRRRPHRHEAASGSLPRRWAGSSWSASGSASRHRAGVQGSRPPLRAACSSRGGGVHVTQLGAMVGPGMVALVPWLLVPEPAQEAGDSLARPLFPTSVSDFVQGKGRSGPQKFNFLCVPPPPLQQRRVEFNAVSQAVPG